jgi:hypothetical protein
MAKDSDAIANESSFALIQLDTRPKTESLWGSFIASGDRRLYWGFANVFCTPWDTWASITS